MPETIRRTYRIDPATGITESPTITVVDEPIQVPTANTYEVENLVTDLGSDIWGTLDDLRLSTSQLHGEIVGECIAHNLQEETNVFSQLPSWSWETDAPVAGGGLPEGGVIEPPRVRRVAERDVPRNTTSIQSGDEADDISRPARLRTFSGTARIRDVDLGGQPVPDNVDRRCIVRPDRKTGVESWKTE